MVGFDVYGSVRWNKSPFKYNDIKMPCFLQRE